MKKGAEDFNVITEISQAAANDPAVRAQSVYHIDYLAGKWNPARTNGMSEGVRLGVTDWHNPMLALARQAQKDPKVIANQYFGTGDLELDSPIGLDESPSTGTGIGSARGNRKSIGLESRPIYHNNAGSALNPRSSLGQRRGSTLSTNRGFADDQRMFENDMGYDFDRFDSRFNNGRNNNRYGNSRFGNPRNNPRYNNRNGFNNRNNQFDRFNSPDFRR